MGKLVKLSACATAKLRNLSWVRLITFANNRCSLCRFEGNVKLSFADVVNYVDTDSDLYDVSMGIVITLINTLLDLNDMITYVCQPVKLDSM